MDNRWIGVYDSGMGGLSLWKELKKSLPQESILYLGDGKNCPYGEKSAEEVKRFAFEAVEELIAKDCKMIVIACNTATSTAISDLREAYPNIPFVGMEPAIKPACRDTKSGVVAVLATKRSLESELFAETLARNAVGIDVVKQVGDGFVEVVEQGLESTDYAYDLVKPIIDAMAEKGVDKIVLGCTHYPFLTPQILRAIGDREIDVVDPSAAIVKRIDGLLEQFDMRCSDDNQPVYEFDTFAGIDYRNMLIERADGLFI